MVVKVVAPVYWQHSHLRVRPQVAGQVCSRQAAAMHFRLMDVPAAATVYHLKVLKVAALRHFLLKALPAAAKVHRSKVVPVAVPHCFLLRVSRAVVKPRFHPKVVMVAEKADEVAKVADAFVIGRMTGSCRRHRLRVHHAVTMHHCKYIRIKGLKQKCIFWL
jgi:hypothetical protein